MDRYKVLDVNDVMSISEITIDKISDYEVNDGGKIENWQDVQRVIAWWDEETDGENYIFVLDRNGRVIDAYNKRFLFNIFEVSKMW